MAVVLYTAITTLILIAVLYKKAQKNIVGALLPNLFSARSNFYYS